jgi:nitroreductase
VTTTVVAPTATTAVELHHLLAERWSPRAFDPAAVPDEDVTALLEAARWAPSANNHQPWRFLVGRHGVDGADRTHRGLFDALAAFNQVWASAAPVLVAAIVEVEHQDGSAREIAPYELGLAVGQLTLEAAARGLHVHQMGGFDAAQVSETFAVPPQYRTVVVLAVGRLGDPETLPAWAAARETAERVRRPLTEIAFTDEWDHPYPT